MHTYIFILNFVLYCVIYFISVIYFTFRRGIERIRWIHFMFYQLHLPFTSLRSKLGSTCFISLLWGSLSEINIVSFLNAWKNSLGKSSGSWLTFVGKFFLMQNSVLVTDTGLLWFSLSSCVSLVGYILKQIFSVIYLYFLIHFITLWSVNFSSYNWP